MTKLLKRKAMESNIKVLLGIALIIFFREIKLLKKNHFSLVQEANKMLI